MWARTHGCKASHARDVVHGEPHGTCVQVWRDAPRDQNSSATPAERGGDENHRSEIHWMRLAMSRELAQLRRTARPVTPRPHPLRQSMPMPMLHSKTARHAFLRVGKALNDRFVQHWVAF